MGAEPVHEEIDDLVGAERLAVGDAWMGAGEREQLEHPGRLSRVDPELVPVGFEEGDHRLRQYIVELVGR